jgi:hypothetical protein
LRHGMRSSFLLSLYSSFYFYYYFLYTYTYIKEKKDTYITQPHTHAH